MDRFTLNLFVEEQLLQSKHSLLKAIEPGSIVQRGFALLRDEEGGDVSTVKKIKSGLPTYSSEITVKGRIVDQLMFHRILVVRLTGYNILYIFIWMD